jgi:hypothetical protein
MTHGTSDPLLCQTAQQQQSHLLYPDLYKDDILPIHSKPTMDTLQPG